MHSRTFHSVLDTVTLCTAPLPQQKSVYSSPCKSVFPSPCKSVYSSPPLEFCSSVATGTLQLGVRSSATPSSPFKSSFQDGRRAQGSHRKPGRSPAGHQRPAGRRHRSPVGRYRRSAAEPSIGRRRAVTSRVMATPGPRLNDGNQLPETREDSDGTHVPGSRARLTHIPPARW